MPILWIHLFRNYNLQDESDIIRLEAAETERRSRLRLLLEKYFSNCGKIFFFFYFLRQILNKIDYYMPGMFLYNDTENDWISST